MPLLQILASGKWYFTHSFEAIVLLGLTLSTIGFLIGRHLWERSHEESRRLEKINNSLRAQHTQQKKSNDTLSAQLDLLS